MSELHKFLFEGLPVRGMLVRLTDSWKEILERRATEPFEAPVSHLLGEMAAAGVLLQSTIKFEGALIFQIFGDGPVKVAVVEVQQDLAFRTTAKVVGELPSTDSGRLPLDAMVNVSGNGRCALTLDPQERGESKRQPYQGVVSLSNEHGQPVAELSSVLEHYMRQSEQLETRLVLAANDDIAAGILIQRLPLEGEGNLEGKGMAADDADMREAYNRIAHLASTLTREELLTLDADIILRRLFWEEDVLYFPAQTGQNGPRFACTCSQERVAGMLRNLGREEVDSIVQEQGKIEVGCEFCGKHYLFDAVDSAELFTDERDLAPGPTRLQ